MAELTETPEVLDEAVERFFSARAVGIGGVVLSLTSMALGVLFAEYRLRRKYEAFAENEISEMREFYARKELLHQNKGDLDTLVKEKGYDIPGAIEVTAPPHPEADPTAIETEEPPRPLPPPVPVTEKRNIFEEHKHEDEWNYEEELATRRRGTPYVIHYDEIGETGYESPTTFTYYAGDDVLCDERDKIVDDRHVLLGEDNLDKFGHGSNDPVIVYIRNDDIAAEFEVIRSDKSFAMEVHGLSHSDTNYPRRRQPFDDEY